MQATVDTSDAAVRNQFHHWLDLRHPGFATRSGALRDKLTAMGLQKVIQGDTAQRLELLTWLAEQQ